MGGTALAKPPLILLAGYFGYGNAGDELILRLLRETLSPVAGAGLRYLAGPRPAFPGGVPRRNPGAVLSALRDARALVLGGGELFQTRTSRRSLAAYLALPAAMGIQRKPFWVFGVGVDPDLPPLALRATAATLRRARGVWARDEASRAALAGLGVASVVMADTVWALPVPPPAAPGGTRRRVVWIPRFPNGADTLARLAPLINELSDFEHALLPLHPPLDAGPLQALRALLRGDVATWAWAAPEELPRRLMEADVVVSMRYHGLVLAALAGRPVVALAAHGKVALLGEEMGVPVLRPGDATAESLATALRRAAARPPVDPATRAASARSALRDLARVLSSSLIS